MPQHFFWFLDHDSSYALQFRRAPSCSGCAGRPHRQRQTGAGNASGRDGSVSRFLRSRSPVREAIRILTAEGLIEPAGNRGVQVRRAEAEEIIQTLSVIGTLEAMAGELAAAFRNRKCGGSTRLIISWSRRSRPMTKPPIITPTRRSTGPSGKPPTTQFCCRSSSGSTHGSAIPLRGQ